MNKGSISGYFWPEYGRDVQVKVPTRKPFSCSLFAQRRRQRQRKRQSASERKRKTETEREKEREREEREREEADLGVNERFGL